MQLQRSPGMSCSTSPLPFQPVPRHALSNRSPNNQRSEISCKATKVKVCGVTNPQDARVAAEHGADFIGMIMWPKAKRSVTDAVARSIAATALDLGATPVGVFVDEDADTINRRCKAAGIPVAQLHGDGARASISGLDAALGVIWVLHATPDGHVVTALPDSGTTSGRQVDWVLMDGLQGGSGQALDWSALQPPTHLCKRGWLLAGGLKPDNVQQAVAAAQPWAVDVSSGVCGPDGLLKDASKVVAFIQAAKGSAS